MQERKIFIDTHVHTIHSELDGMCKLEEYIDYGKKNEFPALFCSDHGNISCWIPFYLQCREAGIKPILGSEFYLSEGLKVDLEGNFLEKDEKLRLENKKNFHLNFYAKNLTGYKNIIKLTTWANMENYYIKPRLTMDIIKQYSDGIICTSSCVGSIFAYYILRGEKEKALDYIKQFKEIFKEDFYIEYGYHYFDNEKIYIEALRRFAKDLNIKTIIANDTHYMYKEDELAHKILMCKGESTLLDKSDFNYTHNYYKSYTEICETFSEFGGIDIDECMKNTFEIIDKVEEYNIPLGQYIYPELKNTEGLSQIDFLKEKIEQGLKRRFKEVTPEIKERTEYELNIIEKMNFAGYFNVVSDYLMWAKNNNIPVGPARGCLIYDTPVITSKGIKKLGEIKIGEKVLTYDGSWQKILKTHEYNCVEQLLQIKTWGSSQYIPTMTLDHKVLVVKNPFKKNIIHNNDGQWVRNMTKIDKSKYLNPNNLSWVMAKNIEIGDYTVRPVNKRFFTDISEIDLAKYATEKDIITENEIIEYYGENQHCKARQQKIPRFLKIDKDFMYLVGFYMGDGWTHNNAIILACNTENDLHVIEKIKEYFYYAKIHDKQDSSKKVKQVCVNSRIINKFFKDIIPSYAKNKKIPDFILGQSDELLQFLLKGLIESDGCIKGRIAYDSVNLELIEQIRYIAELLGYVCTIITRKGRVDSRGYNCSESYKIQLNYKTKSGIFYNDGKYVYTRVKNINTYINDSKKVYDITVENNSNYQTLDYIVHNSGAGSLVNYLIGITEVNPLKYDLLFERFLNPQRLNMPDIDSDVETSRRADLLQHLTQQYGQKSCIPISTRGFLKGKSSIKAVSSKLGLDFNKYNKLLSSIKDPSIDTVQKVVDSSIELTNMYSNDEEFKKVVDIAKKLEGSIQSISVHASAVCLELSDISDYVPIIKTKDGYATGWTDKIVEKCGLIKYDILGLSNLSVIDQCCKLIGNNFDIKKIPLNDEKTYKNLQNGDNLGCFQIESQGMKSLLKRLKPENIEHISAILALYRPGSMQFIEDYIKNKNNLDEIQYFDERVKPILEKTYGQIVYQEQVMAISRVLAGYTIAEADSLRRAIGKKIMSEMLSHEDKFIKGCVNNNILQEKAKELFDQIVEFAKYSFNASHSVSYSFITYQTAYLKANYPVQFMCALLNCNSDDLEKLNLYIGEALRLGITILPPDVNESNKDFTINNKNEIRFGLEAIKGLGKSAITDILKARQNGNFKSVINLIERTTKVDKNNLQSLLRVGAFNSIEKFPLRWDKLCDYISDAKNSKIYQEINDLEKAILYTIATKNAKKSERYLELVNLKRELGGSKSDKIQKEIYNKEQENIVEKFKLNVNKYFLQFTKYTPSERIKNEQELLGFNVSTNPYKKWNDVKKFFISNNSIDYIDMNVLFENGEQNCNLDKFCTVGLLSDIKELKTKKGDRMARLTVEYYGIKTVITVFSNKWENNLEFKLQKGNLIVIVGKLTETNKQYSSEDYEIKFESIQQLNALVNENNKCIINIDNKDINFVNSIVNKISKQDRLQNLPIERIVLYQIGEKFKVLGGLNWINNADRLCKELA